MRKFFIYLSLITIPSAITAQKQGYLNITSFGVLAGTSADEKPAPLSIISEHHYRFNNYISLGAMTGIEQLNENTLPAAVNLKLFLPAGACEFFLTGLCGYSVSLAKPETMGIQKANGGFMTGAETGLLIRVNSGSSLVIAIGYRYNELNYKLQDWWAGNYTRKITYNRFAVHVGIAIY